MRPAYRAALIVVASAAANTAAARDTLGPAAGIRSSQPTPQQPTRESLAERRAVRGVAIEGGDGSESPELRSLRRFEERAFLPNGVPFQGNADDEPQALPPGLQGRWGGTGDIPRELRSPEHAISPPPAKPSQDWLRRLALPDLPIRWEPQVVRYLEFFKDDPKGRAIMATWFRRMGRYRAIIERRLDEQGLPKDLIYLAMIESGFDPGATSNRSAGGVWQFIPGAARAYGLEVSHWVDARRDPERASEAAARLLKDLYVRFGSWPLAFAAYNAGYGAILRAIARFNTNDFWELARHEAGLPWETTLYVPKILAAALVGHNPKVFGLAEAAQDPPWEFDRVEVPSGTQFASLARAAGARPEVIDELNPEYIRGRVPPDRPTVVLRVPLGSAVSFAKALGGVRTAGAGLQPVVLRFGETLDDVAKARGCTARELKRINNVTDASELRAGMTILVPNHALAPAPAPSGDEADDTILVAVPDRSFAYQGRERVFYRTRDGDTLADIAQVFDVAPEDIVEWNHIDPDAKLQPKLILQLFVREGFDRGGVVLLDPDKVRIVTLGSEEFLELETARRGKTRLFYSARAGDTLAKIAKRYGLSPGDLARINRLSAVSELGEGQRVVVYSPTPELPKEITSKVTGAPPLKKQVLAIVEPRSAKAPFAKSPAISQSKGKPQLGKVSVAPASSKPSPGKASPAPTGKPQAGKVGSVPTGKPKVAPAAPEKKPNSGKR